MYGEAFELRSPHGKCASNVFQREGWITPEHKQDYKTLKLPDIETGASTCWINVQTTALLLLRRTRQMDMLLNWMEFLRPF